MSCPSFSTKVYAQNILNNPGFETGDFTGWKTYQSNNYVQAGNSARSGTYFYKVYGQFNTFQNYTGIYQDNPSRPGAIYSADGWAYSSGGDLIHGQDQAWIEVSFLDSSSNALALYRSPVVTGANVSIFGGTNTWFDLPITNQCFFTNRFGAGFVARNCHQRCHQSRRTAWHRLCAIPNCLRTGAG